MKECKPKECQRKRKKLQWTEQGKEKDHVTDGLTKLKSLKYNGSKKQVGKA